MIKFWQRGISSLRKEITILVVAKLIAIFLLWWLFFSAPNIPDHPLLQHLLQTHTEKRVTHDSGS